MPLEVILKHIEKLVYKLQNSENPPNIIDPMHTPVFTDVNVLANVMVLIKI